MRFLSKVLFIFTVMLFAGMASSSSFAKTVKVGVVLPMTGPIASFGQSAWKGMELAQSLQPTVLNGRKIRLILLDNKGGKVGTANAVSRLIFKNKVSAILGAVASGNTMSGGPIAEKAHVPMVTPASTNPLVTKGMKYISRVCFIDPFQGKVAAKYVYNNLHARTAAVVVDIAQDYSVGLAKFFIKAFKKLGGKIVAKTFIQTGDVDFSAQIAVIKSHHPDVIYMPTYYQSLALFARQAKQFGLKQTIMAGDGASEEALIKVGGKAVNGLTFTNHFDPTATATPLGKKFVKLYRAKYNEDPSAMAALGADAYFVVADAINRAGSTNRKKINTAIRTTKDFKGVTGVITLVNGDPVKSAVIQKVENGKFTYVTTINP